MCWKTVYRGVRHWISLNIAIASPETLITLALFITCFWNASTGSSPAISLDGMKKRISIKLTGASSFYNICSNKEFFLSKLIFTWWNSIVISFLPVLHCDTWFNGISKAVLWPTSKLNTDPLNLAVPQFQPFRLNSLSNTSILYVFVKNFAIFSFSVSLKPANLCNVPFFRKILKPQEPTKFWKFTTSRSEDCSCSTFPVLLFLNTIPWSVIFNLPGVCSAIGVINSTNYKTLIIYFTILPLISADTSEYSKKSIVYTVADTYFKHGQSSSQFVINAKVL